MLRGVSPPRGRDVERATMTMFGRRWQSLAEGPRRRVRRARRAGVGRRVPGGARAAADGEGPGAADRAGDVERAAAPESHRRRVR